jgi:hypothetical protein
MSSPKGHPYQDLDPSRFWASGVARHNPLEISGLWHPKAPLPKSARVATFGSCFAQHIGRALVERGYNWFDAEPAPERMAPATRSRFGYGVFSARTGNIYTPTLLLQWVKWALDLVPVPDEIWHQEGRCFDPFRPAIEPEGFADPEELLASRRAALNAFRRVLEEARVFVFTLGLTESWRHKELDHEYPMCPGTHAGTFDPEAHVFVNLGFAECRAALAESIRLMRGVNPGLRFLLTVSPVPLTATMSDRHVLVATTESKSILRAVAGDLARANPRVDYFPSYEIITAPAFRGMFFESNQRSVAAAGVRHVMAEFFRALDHTFPASNPDTPARKGKGKGAKSDADRTRASRPAEDENAVVCEEELLSAFTPKDGRA